MRHPLFKLIPFLTVFWAGGLLWFITLIPFAPASDEQHTDAVVVLTGGALRLERGFELLAEGRAGRMFISGVEDGVTLPSLLKSREYRAFAGRIPPDSVELGYKARSTIGNAEETAQWMAREHIESIRLVTGNYHLPRSLYEMHHAAPDVTILPEPVFPRHFDNNDWWQFGDSLKLVFLEYNKYWVSALHHSIEDLW